jgi:hypothetical protein
MDIIEKINLLEGLIYWKIAVMNAGDRRPIVKEIVPSEAQAREAMKYYKKEYKFVDMRPTNRQEYDDHNSLNKVEWGSMTFANKRLS